MEKITVYKEELLETLKANRQKHRDIFLEAQKGYREKAIELLDKSLENARNNEPFNMSFSLVQPVDQTKDYDRAIKMIEMSINSRVEIDEEDFACFVMDDWLWKKNFLTTNAMYCKTKIL